jgi:hypothetical protein
MPSTYFESLHELILQVQRARSLGGLEFELVVPQNVVVRLQLDLGDKPLLEKPPRALQLRLGLDQTLLGDLILVLELAQLLLGLAVIQQVHVGVTAEVDGRGLEGGRGAGGRMVRARRAVRAGGGVGFRRPVVEQVVARDDFMGRLRSHELLEVQPGEPRLLLRRLDVAEFLVQLNVKRLPRLGDGRDGGLQLDLLLNERLLQLRRIQLDENLVRPHVVLGDEVAFLDNVQNLHALKAADFALEVLRLQRLRAAALQDVDLQRPAARGERRIKFRGLSSAKQTPDGRDDEGQERELQPPRRFEDSGNHVNGKDVAPRGWPAGP